MKLAAVLTLLACADPARMFAQLEWAGGPGIASIDAPGTSSSSTTAEGVQSIPVPRSSSTSSERRTFRDVTFTVAANSLGGGVQVATPLSRRIELRGGMNFVSLAYPIQVTGLNYQANIRLESSQMTLDWFPVHSGFHISSGVLYFRDTVNGAITATPGQSFSLGSDVYLSGTSDPVNGEGSISYARKIAPLLALGFSVPLAGGGRFSMPVELGAAYTGAPQITMQLDGTACVTLGCVKISSNAEALASLAQEVSKLNGYLARVPVYPIVSVGVAYHF